MKKRKNGIKEIDKKSDSLFFPLSGKERLGLLVKSLGVILLLNACFYRRGATLLFLIPVGTGFYCMERKRLLQKKQEEARQQFKEMLLLVTAGQKAGYSVENAFLKSYDDLAGLFGESSSICCMLRRLRWGLANHIPVEELWMTMGKMTGIGEIKEFADVFRVAKESGGNMTVMMERTSETIEAVAETQREIETLLGAARLEQRLMNGMPVFLVLYVGIVSPGYFDRLYHSMEGIVIMTGALLFYLAAFWLGTKMAEVRVV